MNRNYSLHIDESVLSRAQLYAQSKGISLSSIIEAFLAKWTKEQSLEEKLNNFPISSKVKSLAGRMKTNADAIDFDQLRDEYLKEKSPL